MLKFELKVVFDKSFGHVDVPHELRARFAGSAELW